MLRVAIILFLVIFSTFSFSQELVANGNLDERNVCTEFRAKCAPEAWFFLPRYVANSLTTDSIHYCEALCIGNLARGFWSVNYLYTKTLCRLERGKKYRFSIWINCGQNDFDHLDVWMGMEEPKYKQMDLYFENIAFTITPGDADSLNGSWRKYNYVFTARGDERFLMFGNLTKGEIDKSKVYNSNRNGNIYYYVDNISLTPLVRTSKVCREYYGVLKQVYDQDKRHPPRLIEEIPFDSTIISNPFATGSDASYPIENGYAETKPFLKSTYKPGERSKQKDPIKVLPHDKNNELKPPPTLLNNSDRRPGQVKSINDTLFIPDILFEYNSSKLNPIFLRKLNAMLQKLQVRNFERLEIVGHTDNIGSADYNLKLSLNRAYTIKNYIVAKLLINSEIIFVTGMGDTKPRDTNETGEGRQRNRRVEIVVEY